MKHETTIKKVAAAWNKKLWGFYDLQFMKTEQVLIGGVNDGKRVIIPDDVHHWKMVSGSGLCTSQRFAEKRGDFDHLADFHFFRLAFFLGLLGLMSETRRIISSNLLALAFFSDFGFTVKNSSRIWPHFQRPKKSLLGERI